MTERVMDLMEGPMTELMLHGFGMGSIIAITAILLGYAINRALSLVDNK